METTTIVRIVAGILALVVLATIIYRRKKHSI
jgi:LPXTG-motif cell wall-anchored protein